MRVTKERQMNIIFEDDKPKKRKDNRVSIPAELYDQLKIEGWHAGFNVTAKYIQCLLLERDQDRDDNLISRHLAGISQDLHTLSAAVRDGSTPLKSADLGRFVAAWEVLCRDLQTELRK